MLSGPTCKFLSSLHLGIRESFLEKVVSELGHRGLTHGFCVRRASLEKKPAGIESLHNEKVVTRLIQLRRPNPKKTLLEN